MITYTIDYELADLNTYIRLERANRFNGAKVKKNNTWLCKLAADHLDEITTPFYLHITWYAKDKRKDPDNISFAVKFILDGLQDAGIIQNDNFKTVLGIYHDFAIDAENPRVQVDLIPKNEYAKS